MKNSNVHPTAKSYLLLLQCCSNLLPRGSVEQEKNLQSIFRSCRKSGLVNKYVLAEFRSTVSTDTYHKEVVQDAPYFNCVKSLPGHGLGILVTGLEYVPQNTEYIKEIPSFLWMLR